MGHRLPMKRSLSEAYRAAPEHDPDAKSNVTQLGMDAAKSAHDGNRRNPADVAA